MQETLYPQSKNNVKADEKNPPVQKQENQKKATKLIYENEGETRKPKDD